MTGPVWSQRIQATPTPAFERLGLSIQEDAAFFEEEIACTRAHIATLAAGGILSTQEAEQLQQGLAAIHTAWAEGTLRFLPELEDIHMNVEHHLKAHAPQASRKLHAGRSRNDQVASILLLKSRSFLSTVEGALSQLQTILAQVQKAQGATPWLVRTHGVPAQVATVDYLLAAYQLRFEQLASHAHFLRGQTHSIPLGSAAVSGSSLPLPSQVGAATMGLDAPIHALLQTGARDVHLQLGSFVELLGIQVANLARELFDATLQGTLSLDASLTTGSSLMPHKRNADSLELLHGLGQQLSQANARSKAVLTGQSLGYHREFQRLKPELLGWIDESTLALEVLAEVLRGLHFHAPAQIPDGAYATDALDALVENGWIFRDAYEALGRVFHHVEAGATLDAALANALGPAAQVVQEAFAGLRTKKTPGSPGHAIGEALA